MTINLEVGTNTYISLTDAEGYFATRPFSDAWSGSDDDKAKALIWATRTIDRQVLRGRKYDVLQTLEFPRLSTRQSRWATSYIGRDPAEVPQEVIDATCEEALAILDRGGDTRRKLQHMGVNSFGLGNGISEQMDTNRGRGLISQEARELMARWLGGSVGAR